MPTVRELKNRITFNVDKSTVANAENTFGKLKKGAVSVISIVKGVGAAIVSVVALSSKQFIELEKDIGATNFFSRSKEDAKELLRLTQDIAKLSVTTSQREGGQAAAILSQIPGIEKFRKELLPILEEISIANPKLDFTGVTDAFSQLVKEGNLDALKNLIPGSAELLEKLALSTFNFADRTKTAANRTQLFLEQINKVRPELKRLADDQRKTLGFQAAGISKETFDFFTNFGRTVAPEMTKLFEEIRLTIRELNENESFWQGVKEAAELVRDAFREAVFLAKLLSGDEETAKEAIRIGREKEAEDRALFEKQKKQIINLLPSFGTIASGTGNLLTGALKNQPTQSEKEAILGGPLDININGRFEVDVRGADNVDGNQLTEGISKTVIGAIKEKMRNVAAQNGRVVATGGP
ncbi:hypothetical protein KAR91_05035 [Candidatus Pacearchaeota archaeon]|nr:hypothetical protein [Candidatus Pacearchaeota archaeon]